MAHSNIVTERLAIGQAKIWKGTLGYRVPLTTVFSLTGSAGVGEHWRQNPTASFSYYVLRIAADLVLNQTITWNVVSFRYRDGFDPYNTPQIATGFTSRAGSQVL